MRENIKDGHSGCTFMYCGTSLKSIMNVHVIPYITVNYLKYISEYKVTGT